MAAGTIPANFPINDTNAHFEAWGSAFATGVQNAGFSKTADTGQINWATVAAPLAANTKQGYEIYSFADTLSATKPLFFRIDYGSGTATNTPAIWLTVGTGSDGAGTITNTGGTVYGPTQTQATGSTAGTAYAGYYSGLNATTRGRLMIAMFQGTAITSSSTYPFFLMIERSKDNTGADTGAGAIIMLLNTTPTASWAFFKAGVAQPTIETKIGALFPVANVTMISGSTVGISSPVSFNPAPQQSGITFLVGYATDYTAYDSWTFPLYGTTYTWLVMKFPAATFVGTAATNCVIIMHYD